MGESAKTTWGFIIQNRIFFLFLFFAKVGGGGYFGWAVAHCVIYIVEKHIRCSFPHVCMSDSGAEACGLSRILNAALTMKLGGTSRSHRRELCEWESERKKKRRWGENCESKASWRQNADSPCDACISSCCPVSKLRRQENIAVTEVLAFLHYTHSHSFFCTLPKTSWTQTSQLQFT